MSRRIRLSVTKRLFVSDMAEFVDRDAGPALR